MRSNLPIIIFFLLFVSGVSHAKHSEAEQRSAVKLQCERMNAAIFARDFDTLVSYYSPSLIAFYGGRDNLVKGMKAATAASVPVFERIAIGEPFAFYPYKKTVQCLIADTLFFKYDSTNHRLMGNPVVEFSIATSTDGGVNWKFIKSVNSEADYNDLRNALPPLSPKLVQELKKRWVK